MNKGNINKGKWVKGWGNGLTGPTTPNSNGPTVDSKRKYIPISKDKETIAIVIQQENNSMDELEANAQLIAEAGNVFNECGLTPRELLEQRNELLEALENAMEVMKLSYNDSKLPNYIDLRNANDAINKLKEVK